MREHWIISVIRDLEGQKFFGELTLKFRNGKIVLVEERRTILPPEEEKNSIRESINA